MGRFADLEEKKARRQAELELAGNDLAELNSQLGIHSTLQTVMPTSGPDAFIGVSTGFAIVKINHLEDLRDRIAFLEAELERWQRIDANGAQ